MAANITRSLFCLCCILICVIKVQSQVRQIYVDANPINEVKKFSFYSKSSGFVAFEKWIGFTTDSAHTFSQKPITLANVNYNGYPVNLTFGFTIEGVQAFDQNNLLAYGHYGLVPAILKSTDGGSTFTLVFHSLYSPSVFKTGITDMVFTSSTVGYAVDADRILRTSNQGATWTVIKSEPNAYFDYLETAGTAIFAFTGQSISSKMLYSLDGFSWYQQNLPYLSGKKLRYAYFLTANKGWINMGNGAEEHIFYTSNGGSSWREMNNSIYSPYGCVKMKFVNDSTGYGISGLFDIYKTTDSGKVWQRLPRDNNFTYLNYSNVDLSCSGTDQFWAGGGSGFTQLSTNGGGIPLPRAMFNPDTSGVQSSNTVNLRNLSKPTYQYKWLKNGVQISTAYNTSFTRTGTRLRDTISLIVLNGTKTDTATQYVDYFPRHTISSFSPTTGAPGTLVTIYGTDLQNATSVYFGATAADYFVIISPTQINAFVGAGSSGAVTINAYYGSASLPGFNFIALPNINLPSASSKTILCKSESVQITVQNTEAGVQYSLLDSLGNIYGASTSNVNGSTVTFNTSPISVTGTYHIKATRTAYNIMSHFTNTIFFTVEKTKSHYNASRVNIQAGESVSFTSHSEQAQTYNWTLYDGASLATATGNALNGISYATLGTKSVRLVSISINGCKDTLTATAVNVYAAPSPAGQCYIQNVNDSDWSYAPLAPTLSSKITPLNDNGYIISGLGNRPTLKSRVGATVKINDDDIAYYAKYSSEGVLSWYGYIRRMGRINATATDQFGNIYISGESLVHNYFYLPNGDSIKVGSTGVAPSYSTKQNGFILKLDPNGNYLWHVIITDPSNEFAGYPTHGGVPQRLLIKDDNIFVTGGFLANLGYYRNGVQQTLITLTNSTYANDLQNFFVFKLNTDGALKWHLYVENDATNQIKDVSGIGMDVNGDVYMSGYYEQKLSFHDAGNVTNFDLIGNTGHASAYLFKLDSLGRYKWKALMSDAKFLDLSVQPGGSCYLACKQKNTSQLTAVSNSGGTINLSSYSVLKISAEGIYKWSAGSQSSYYGQANALTVKGNEVYASGNISQNGLTSANFTFTSATTGTITKQIYSSETFMAKYDTSGSLITVAPSGINTGGEVIPNTITRDNAGHLLLSGLSTMGNGGTGNYTVYNNSLTTRGADAFFLKTNTAFCSGSLPLTLINFDAVLAGSYVNLLWKTADEKELTGFRVEQSTDLRTWNELTFVSAYNIRGINNYAATDAKPYEGINYYRLKMINKDGSFTYSDIHNISFRHDEFSINPNPARSEFLLRCKGFVDNVALTDIAGKQVAFYPVSANAASGIKINLSSVPPGTYVVRIYRKGIQQKSMIILVLD